MNKHHVMIPGPISTGKSINALEVLSKNLNEKFTSIFISFTA